MHSGVTNDYPGVGMVHGMGVHHWTRCLEEQVMRLFRVICLMMLGAVCLMFTLSGLAYISEGEGLHPMLANALTVACIGVGCLFDWLLED